MLIYRHFHFISITPFPVSLKGEKLYIDFLPPWGKVRMGVINY